MPVEQEKRSMKNIVTINDVHQQFAEYFDVPALKPFIYLLSKKLGEGHICLDLHKLEGDIQDLPGSYANQVDASRLYNSQLVAINNAEDKPFILHNGRLYFQRYFKYETNFLRYIAAFLQAEESVLQERINILQQHEAQVRALFPGGSTPEGSADKVDWQLAAAISGVLNNFTIITGGPGTGKTTTVAKILSILYTIDPQLKVALAAPTGKAAARMAESLRNAAAQTDPATAKRFQDLSPSTIHRLLKPINGSHYFKHNEENPLNYDVMIVDECSMIDLALFSKLLSAIKPTSRLIMLGDKDQLASVEAGSLFGDLCQAQEQLNVFSPERTALMNSFMAQESAITTTANEHQSKHPLFEHVVELRHSRRFTGHAGIGRFSKALIQNNVPVIQAFLVPGADEEVHIDQQYNEKLFEQFISEYAEFIKEKDIRLALKKLNNLRVLVAIRDGAQGLTTINRRIEKYLQDKKLLQVSTNFYENKPIMLTRNYYEHGLFNGDTGIIRKDESGVLMAWFEDTNGDLKAVFPGYLAQAETAFAMTIHKSQGSEFTSVLVVLPVNETPILTRELLYTAVSRARKKVFVQGSEQTIINAAAKFVDRGSGINARMAAGKEDQ
ncbi:DNA helicase/exodeoxyribonuclease V alpha subunit [Chitinophaga skermanii]|uniref:RecBCD enzyme subunit RecD n=1 Tax=Chitinophaga skermanii TaxID=331697 RepID=A0A327Q3U6_9BACT|nr:exodeoxyribonuclease V subunit alpha [Chitinophaga skermanii]RAI97852.1 DNA helicase/exodeoxyribonuclease V alpha subunit [Chitinophaga skermanii]